MEIGDKAFIEKYLHKDHDKELYLLKLQEYQALKLHANGKAEDAVHLMKAYQPSEPEWAIQYKKENFRAITKAPFTKIKNSIAKIQRARDFIITEGENDKKVKDSETLYKYCFEQFPKFNSLNNWFFNFQIQNYLIDSNGIVVFAPKYVLDGDYLEEYKNLVTDNKFIEPIPYSFSVNKIKYFEDNLLIIECEKDKEWYIIDNNAYTLIKKEKGKYITTELCVHNLGYIPAIYNGGVLQSEDDDYYYESFVAGIIPDFDQALLENIDKNVTIKQHLYPERVEFSQGECTTCSGLGYVTRNNSFGRSVRVTCSSCDGEGSKGASPFKIHRVRPALGSESENIPDWAPVKYVQKDLKPVEFLSIDIDNLIKKGLSAVNMEFLAESPTDQSGVSKSYDYDQTHLFLSNISNDIFGRLYPFYIKCINDLRYGVLLEFNQTLLDKQLPKINIPNDFDIITAQAIESQIASATTAGVSSSIIESMQMDYVSKKYEGNQREISYQKNIILLDDLRGMSYDDILTSNSIVQINPLTITVHNFINSFVERAFVENKDFDTFDLARKKQIMLDYANEYQNSFKKPTLPINPNNGIK